MKQIKNIEDLSKEDLLKLLDISTQNAVKESFDKGLAITITQGNKLIKLYPDGKIEIIEELSDEIEIVEKKKIFE